MAPGERYSLNRDEIASEVIGGEAVILNLSSGTYYGLDGAGGLAWAMLERGHTTAEVVAELTRRYAVSAEHADADVEGLFAELSGAGLLIPSDAEVGTPVEDHQLPPPGEYRKPELQTFSDMSDLLALDPPMPGIKEVPWQSPGG